MPESRSKTLITFVISLCLVFGFAMRADAFIDDPEYHTVAEIHDQIFALVDSFPDWVHIETIGYSQLEQLPIYAVRVSKDATLDSTGRPAVVFIGQLHAEEVLGVEYCLSLLNKLVSQQGNASQWRRFLDVWIIPTANPEGLEAVHTVDYTYRKNKRDNIGDGLFRWFLGWGNDSSGVDLNRNFPFFWVNGDKLFKQGRNEPYDYYRGPAPLSESESQAIDRFMNRIRPIYSVVIHSSRTGNFAEKVIFPWDFGKNEQSKTSPDINMIGEIAHQMASRCLKYSRVGIYEPSPMKTPNGNSDLYFYWKYGSFAYRIEIGEAAEGMQPDSAGIMTVIEGIRLGFEYLLNSASGVQSDENGEIEGNRLYVKVLDDDTGEPLEARLTIPSWISPIIPFRSTNPLHGIYHWVVAADFRDTVIVSRFGYKTQSGVVSSERNPRRPLEVDMELLPVHQVTLQAVDTDGITIEGVVELVVEHLWSPTSFGFGRTVIDIDPIELPAWYPVDTTWTVMMSNGHIQLDLPEGGYRLTFLNDVRHVPRVVELAVDSSRSWDIALAKASVLLSQNFDGGDIMFSSDYVKNTHGVDSLARWDLTDEVTHTPPRSLTDSKRGNMMIFEDSWCAPYNILDHHFDLSDAGTAALVYWLSQALEPEYDSMTVEASFGGPAGSYPSDWNWTPLATAHQDLSTLTDVPTPPWNAPPINYQRYSGWKRYVVPIDTPWIGSSVVHFRFRVRTDGGVITDGVYIDDILLLSSGEAPPAVTSEPLLPSRMHLGQPYPNPFNGRMQVRATLPEPGLFRLTLFDTQGRIVLRAFDGRLPEGRHLLSIDASSLPNGLYILKGSSERDHAVRKVMLIK